MMHNLEVLIAFIKISIRKLQTPTNSRWCISVIIKDTDNRSIKTTLQIPNLQINTHVIGNMEWMTFSFVMTELFIYESTIVIIVIRVCLHFIIFYLYKLNLMHD